MQISHRRPSLMQMLNTWAGQDRRPLLMTMSSTYRLYRLDNAYIFDFKGWKDVKIPQTSMDRFEEFLCVELQRGKACDISKLTSEHIQECGMTAKR